MKYGIYNNYAEAWWLGEDLKTPKLFDTESEAKAYLKKERKYIILDKSEGVVKEYHEQA